MSAFTTVGCDTNGIFSILYQTLMVSLSLNMMRVRMWDSSLPIQASTTHAPRV